MPFTARIERAPFHRARSCEQEGHLATPSPCWRTFSASCQGFSIDGAEVAPYYTDTIEDDHECSAPSRITPCGAARHESRAFSHVL